MEHSSLPVIHTHIHAQWKVSSLLKMRNTNMVEYITNETAAHLGRDLEREGKQALKVSG